MNKPKSLARPRTQITDIAMDGAKLLDEQHLRLSVGARLAGRTAGSGGGMMAEGGTCLPGTTNDRTYTVPLPSQNDEAVDDVYD